MSTTTLSQRDLARQRAYAAMAKRAATPDPTEEEIAAACEAIQAAWTRKQRRFRYLAARTVGTIDEADVPRWTPQEWRTVDFCVG